MNLLPFFNFLLHFPGGVLDMQSDGDVRNGLFSTHPFLRAFREQRPISKAKNYPFLRQNYPFLRQKLPISKSKFVYNMSKFSPAAQKF